MKYRCGSCVSKCEIDQDYGVPRHCMNHKNFSASWRPVASKPVVIKVHDFSVGPKYPEFIFGFLEVASRTYTQKGNCIRGAKRLMDRLGIRDYEIREK